MTASIPAASACRASAPITSSASQPSIAIRRTPSASITSAMRGRLHLSSSGIFSRVALYAA